MSWRDIPGNPHAFERLRALLDGGEAIGFVGAGASAGLYPLWQGLITQLADAAKARGADTATREAWLRAAKDRPDQAVRGIKQALGDGPYAAALRAIFRLRAGADGNQFTPVQAALMRLPFQGFVTTNFDPGLLAARLALRPGITATGYATHRDHDAVERWNTRDVFREHACPVLFAHGIYERSDTVVLGAGEYREAYRTGPYSRLVRNLWAQAHLVFIGFSFSDAWFNFLANELLTVTGRRTDLPRHIAILPLDQPYAPFLRETFIDQYDTDPLFYPVTQRADGSSDHGALLEILHELGGGPPPGPAVGGTPPTGTGSASGGGPPPAGTPPAGLPQSWMHETTEDDRFRGRDSILAKLDRWSDDAEVRAIALTGMGGIGKTSLLAHWVKRRGGETRRTYAGLFFWSFYNNRSVAALAEALRGFAAKHLGLPMPAKDTPPGEAVLEALRARPMLLLLDGLEVLQETPGGTEYGALLDADLYDLLDGACREDHQGLVVLTSRFPFADLTPHLGFGFRALDLDRLSATEGAALLQACGVAGTEPERAAASERLEGHPLGLRILALALRAQAKGDPAREMAALFDAARLEAKDGLEGKLRRLLGFYEHHLPRGHATLLGLVALFRSPVEEATIRTLAGAAAVAGDLAALGEAARRRALEALARDGLLQREHDAAGATLLSCHPVLRDHFRAGLLARASGLAAEAAGLLTGRPAEGRPTDLRQIEPVLAAIELLLEAGDVAGADRLYRERLENGNLFQSLPAPGEGVRCALGFVGGDRRARSEAALTPQRISFYVSSVGLHAINAGDLALGEGFLLDSAAFYLAAGDDRNRSNSLLNLSQLRVELGRLGAAEEAAREALACARRAEDRPAAASRDILTYLARALGLLGRVGAALHGFAAADAIERRTHPEGASLYSTRGVWWAELLVRLGRTSEARSVTEANRAICRRNGWHDDVARCDILLGPLAARAGELPTARRHLDSAETVLRRGRAIPDLCDALLARAEFGLRGGDPAEAIAAAEEVLRLAAPRGMRLVQADALVLRGRLRLAREGGAAALRAGDDAEAALRLARDCGYAWAERDALALAADSACDTEAARHWQREADALSHRLADTAPPDPDPYPWAFEPEEPAAIEPPKQRRTRRSWNPFRKAAE